MLNELRLNKKPFESIRNKTKTVEMRLYDEKRQRIKPGDTILFKLRDNESETIKVLVKNIKVFKNFEELYKNYDKVSLGYREDETASFKDMEEYYSTYEQKKYGVVAIEIKVL